MVSFHGYSWNNLHGHFPSSATVKPLSDSTIPNQTPTNTHKNPVLFRHFLHTGFSDIASAVEVLHLIEVHQVSSFGF